MFIESEAGQRDILSSWGSADTQPFPNPDRLRVDVGNRPGAIDTYERVHKEDSDFRRPARATATQLYAQWIGGLDPNWGGTIYAPADDPLRVELDPAGTRGAQPARSRTTCPATSPTSR